jgi:hypothetical protein
MFKKLSDWWNRKELKMEAKLAEFEQRYKEELEKQNADRRATEEKLQEAEQEVSMYRARDEADEARRNGTEPWIEIKSAEFNPVKGIHIELDWNDAFIQHLKDNGLKARDDDTLVQKWLAFLYEDLIGRLEQKVIDSSDKPRVNDFE